MYCGVMCLVCLPEYCLAVAFRNVILPWTLEDPPQTAGGSVLYCILTLMVYSHDRFFSTERSTCTTSRVLAILQPILGPRDSSFEMSCRTRNVLWNARARKFRLKTRRVG
uniref:Secreted protein n=1 Tax=Ixodes ricinus TaxID=34613 RepID=A0A6B0UJ26_IXORI